MLLPKHVLELIKAKAGTMYMDAVSSLEWGREKTTHMKES